MFTATEPRSGEVVDNPCRGSGACGATEPGVHTDLQKISEPRSGDVVWTTFPPPHIPRQTA